MAEQALRPARPSTPQAVKVIGGEGGETRSEWEDGPNHVLLIPSSGYDSLNAKVEWGGGTAVLDHVPASSSGSMKKVRSRVGVMWGASNVGWECGRALRQLLARGPAAAVEHAAHCASLRRPRVPTLAQEAKVGARATSGKWGGLLG